MSVIVTGGAGYIGSHVVEQLIQRGDEVTIVDDLSTGNLSRISDCRIKVVDLSHISCVQTLRELANKHGATSVIHLAAKKNVADSHVNPDYYLRQNVGSIQHLLQALEGTFVKNIVFSSSAAVYGNASGSIGESSVTAPINPYGETKLHGELLFKEAASRCEISVGILRYFNVAGVRRSELAEPTSSSLIPHVLHQISSGQPPQIFGDDYETFDGSCVRDFVHVEDVARAHLSTLDYLKKSTAPHSTFNIGSGTGFSVKQVLEVVKNVTSYCGLVEVRPRRVGDPANIVADVNKASEILGWQSLLGLEEMVSSEWAAISSVL